MEGPKSWPTRKKKSQLATLGCIYFQLASTAMAHKIKTPEQRKAPTLPAAR
jgi:hypothetical protein